MVPNEANSKPLTNEPYSLQVHRKQSFWQITFPIILAAIVLLVFLALVLVYSGGFGDNLTSIGAAAAVFVILPHLLGLLIWLAILIAMAYGVNVLRLKLPGQSALILDFLHKFQIGSHKISNLAAQPSIKIASKIAQLEQIFSSLKVRLR